MTDIPDEFVKLARRWYDGSSSMLYAIASTGGLTRGFVRPYYHNPMWEPSDLAHRPYTDHEWEWSLWSNLASELLPIAKRVYGTDAYKDIRRFYDFARQTADDMAIEYNIDIQPGDSP